MGFLLGKTFTPKSLEWKWLYNDPLKAPGLQWIWNTHTEPHLFSIHFDGLEWLFLFFLCVEVRSLVTKFFQLFVIKILDLDFIQRFMHNAAILYTILKVGYGNFRRRCSFFSG